MKTLLISMLCAALVVPAVSAAEEGKKTRIRSYLYSTDYDNLMLKIRTQRFEEALPELKRFAYYGEKHPQYLLGMMMISGEGGLPVNVEEGLSWMRLSLEQRNKDWEKSYKQVTSNLTEAQLASLEPIYQELKSKYGVDVQNMHCGIERMRSSNLKIHICRKNILQQEYYEVTEYTQE